MIPLRNYRQFGISETYTAAQVQNDREEPREMAKGLVVIGALYHAKEFRLYPKDLSRGVHKHSCI